MKSTLSLITLILSFACILHVSCDDRNTKSQEGHHIAKDSISHREYSVQSVLWQQHAAEYRALAYQAFNIARQRIKGILEERNKNEKPMAIITDIDETVLDNSPFNAKLIERDQPYSKERWIEWAQKSMAKPVPGSRKFLKYIKDRDVQIFYISNRYKSNKEATIRNLRQLDYPYADSAHILLKDTTRGKQPRRDQVLAKYNVVMLLGDNLSDFHKTFDNRSTEKRNSLVDSMRNRFGKRFIVLPNPMYGAWETDGIYQGKHDLSTAEKDSIRKKKLESY